MSEPLLHHFDASPFSEKVRLLLGYCGLQWGSVHIPRVMPKPCFTALTGGYRKTPALQLGRDVYCDTALIVRVIEQLSETTSLVPLDQAASVRAMEELGDRLFMAAIPILFRPEGRAVLVEQLGEEALARFQADRAELFSGGSVSRPDDQFSRAVWGPTLATLEAQLAPQPFVLGEHPTLADFSLYHPIWYVRNNPGVRAITEGYPAVMAWFARMQAFGHGSAREVSEAAAHEIAADCNHWQPLMGEFDDSAGMAAGDSIAVHAVDYGVDAVHGRLVHLSAETLTLERKASFEGREIGAVRVHFPRDGFAFTSFDT
ncbi:Glutathione S-transferase [Kushneria avicenniae]|uniref:Glutathione S-transferase n=1 Tax=Kushneria avicenniae TaxID=402385 RepID=A0A1I1LP85_9GAMM|nr:glutathione S-transferase family protein [Kushneria avicenniae]SFC74881.1 Glutathione S-transferase [Kushneria avicenniae]